MTLMLELNTLNKNRFLIGNRFLFEILMKLAFTVPIFIELRKLYMLK